MSFSKTEVSELLPLKGMPLTSLYFSSTKVNDLSPLKGMPLENVTLSSTKVSDLSPLMDAPLATLVINMTQVSDLSPLKGTPLQNIYCDLSFITDLSPLKEMPLESLICDFNFERDSELLHSISTLKSINFKSTAEFWEEAEKKQADFQAWIKQVADLPTEEQVAAVERKLKESNKFYYGNVTPTIENGVIVGLKFFANNQKDISAVRALTALRHLECGASSAPSLHDLFPLKGMSLETLNIQNSLVSDLSPLAAMPLKKLDITNTRVADLSPLKGMPLESLIATGTKITDLSPLKDLPLKIIRAC